MKIEPRCSQTLGSAVVAQCWDADVAPWELGGHSCCSGCELRLCQLPAHQMLFTVKAKITFGFLPVSENKYQRGPFEKRRLPVYGHIFCQSYSNWVFCSDGPHHICSAGFPGPRFTALSLWDKKENGCLPQLSKNIILNSLKKIFRQKFFKLYITDFTAVFSSFKKGSFFL